MAVRPTDGGSLGATDPEEQPAPRPGDTDGTDGTERAGRTGGDPGRARVLRLVTAVALVVALAAATVLVLRFTRDTDSASSTGDRVDQLLTGSDAATDDSAAREEVQSVATQFVLRVNTYGPADLDEQNQMPDYADGVREVITPKFQAGFDDNLSYAEQTVAQAGYARVAQVQASGVQSLDEDAASVLVAGVIKGSYPNPQQEGRIQDTPRPFRFQVSLRKIEGSWLVDDFTPITGEDESGQSGQTGGDQTGGGQQSPGAGTSSAPAAPRSSRPAPSGSATP